MKKIIKKILLEQSWFDDSNAPIKGNISERVFKFLDRAGLEKGITLLNLDDSEKETQVVMSYYKDYDGKWSEDLPVNFDASEIARLFKDRDYNLESIVEGYLKGDYDYSSWYHECFDYNHNWMWDNINEENQNYILEKAKEAGIDMEDDDAVEEFIEYTYGSDIGCAFADAQHDADINALHEDIMLEVESFLSEFNGKWNFDKGEFNGTIPFTRLVNSEYFEDAVRDNLDYGQFDTIQIKNYIIEKEMDDIGYGNTTELFSDTPSINTDRHFRYGGAGDMSESYMNEILSDRLSWH